MSKIRKTEHKNLRIKQVLKCVSIDKSTITFFTKVFANSLFHVPKKTSRTPWNPGRKIYHSSFPRYLWADFHPDFEAYARPSAELICPQRTHVLQMSFPVRLPASVCSGLWCPGPLRRARCSLSPGFLRMPPPAPTVPCPEPGLTLAFEAPVLPSLGSRQPSGSHSS